MNKPGKTGLPRVIDAFRYSCQGFIAAWRNEAAFREECLLLLILIPLAYWLGASSLERVLLIVPGFLILIVELLNSAIEAVVDRIGEEHHVLAGRAKDMGSAAVFVAFVYMGISWLLILLPRYL